MSQGRYASGYYIDTVIDFLAGFFHRLGKISYVCSRVIMLVLVFMSLRSLPPGAYDTVAWIKHIPHINM
jgi:hypothetical protein